MNSQTISIDTLYNQLTAILQEETYVKSRIQLYQEHVKRIKRYMSANDLTYYSPKVAFQYYREVIEPKDYNDVTKRFF